MLHGRRRIFTFGYAAAVYLLIYLQLDETNVTRLHLFMGVTAIPLFLVESSKASCYDIDAIQDTVVKINYKAPRMYSLQYRVH
jgi:hypothetical protein